MRNTPTPLGEDVVVRTDELDRLDHEIREASRGPAEAYVDVLKRAIAACEGDAAAAECLDVVDLHSELAEAYDIPGARAETPEALTAAIREALSRDQPTIIDVPIDGWV